MKAEVIVSRADKIRERLISLSRLNVSALNANRNKPVAIPIVDAETAKLPVASDTPKLA